jgi:hypothetical protein
MCTLDDSFRGKHACVFSGDPEHSIQQTLRIGIEISDDAVRKTLSRLPSLCTTARFVALSRHFIILTIGLRTVY